MLESKKDKKRIQTEQQIFHILVNVVELCPQYTLAQHFCHVLRTKGVKQEAYFWTDEELLKVFEDYYDEIKSDLLIIINED